MSTHTTPRADRRPRRPAPRQPIALLALALLLAAPACTKFTDYDAFVVDPKPIVAPTEYRMAPPDVVLLSSKRVREVNGHIETIRPDGRITLPLIGSVFVAGKTCEEVSAEVQTLAREFYEDADVSIRITAFNSKRIFVFGEVATPGPYPYDGTNTILRTLAEAQPTRLADPGSIHIMRPNSKGELVRRMTIDMNKMVKNGDTALDAVLNEGDILYVPPNAFAAVGLAFQQVLLPIQPAAATAKGPPDIASSTQSSAYQQQQPMGIR